MRFSTLLKCESAQATTEYIVMLAILVGFAVLITRQLIGPALQKMQQALSARIDSMFSERNLHSFPIGK